MSAQIRSFLRRYDPIKFGKSISKTALFGGGASAVSSKLRETLSSFQYENIHDTNRIASDINNVLRELEMEAYLAQDLFEEALQDQCDFVGNPPI